MFGVLIRNKDLLFPDVRNRPSDSISFENPFRAPLKGLLLGSEIRLQALLYCECYSTTSVTVLYYECYSTTIDYERPNPVSRKKTLKAFSNDIESEGLFRTSGNSKSLFLIKSPNIRKQQVFIF